MSLENTGEIVFIEASKPSKKKKKKKKNIYIYIYKHSQMGRGEKKGGKEDECYFLY